MHKNSSVNIRTNKFVWSEYMSFEKFEVHKIDGDDINSKSSSG